MLKALLGAIFAAAIALPALAAVPPYPPGFQSREVDVGGGVTIHVRVGGRGPAVLLLHGFGDTGDMWAPLAAVLVEGPRGDRARPARLRPFHPHGQGPREEERGRRHGEGGARRWASPVSTS